MVFPKTVYVELNKWLIIILLTIKQRLKIFSHLNNDNANVLVLVLGVTNMVLLYSIWKNEWLLKYEGEKMAYKGIVCWETVLGNFLIIEMPKSHSDFGEYSVFLSIIIEKCLYCKRKHTKC